MSNGIVIDLGGKVAAQAVVRQPANRLICFGIVRRAPACRSAMPVRNSPTLMPRDDRATADSRTIHAPGRCPDGQANPGVESGAKAKATQELPIVSSLACHEPKYQSPLRPRPSELVYTPASGAKTVESERDI